MAFRPLAVGKTPCTLLVPGSLGHNYGRWLIGTTSSRRDVAEHIQNPWASLLADSRAEQRPLRSKMICDNLESGTRLTGA